MGSPAPRLPPPNAARQIFQMLVASAIGRCRALESLCRLSVSLQCFHDSDPHSVKISISDTGVGSSLEEFRRLDDHFRSLPPAAAAKWDGFLAVTTTCIRDKEVYRYRLNLGESAGDAERLTRLPSASKNGRKFSGTEVLLSVEVEEGVGEFVKWATGLIRKVAVLRIPNIAFLLESDHKSNQGTKVETIPLENYVLQPLPSSNIECLISGLEDYVHRHGNMLEKMCQSCFSGGESLKVGNGLASSTRKGHIVEVVIVIAEVADSSKSSCSLASSAKNKVLYFDNHLPCTILDSPWHALESIGNSYGFSLEPDLVDDDGHIVLKCEKLPPSMKIVIAIHCYWKKVMLPHTLQRTPVNKNLVKRAIKIGLDDLKMKHRGLFLSPRSLKIQKHVPGLSRTIAGLILSSNDQDFQHECVSILGLHPHDIGIEGKVESCIQEKVTEIIVMNDNKKDAKEIAPCLFECENATEENYNDGGDEGDEDIIMDF